MCKRSFVYVHADFEIADNTRARDKKQGASCPPCYSFIRYRTCPSYGV
jgi:hypothetical protein